MLKKVIKEAGKIDVLVHNAGYALIGPVIELNMADLKKQYDTNLFGAVELTQKVAPHMIKNGSGTIVNISSVSGIMATPFSGAYCSTKAAFNSLSDSLRAEMAPFGIDVLIVRPGGIQSKFSKTASKGLERYKKKNSFYSKFYNYIWARANDSQQNATTPEELSESIVEKVESKNKSGTLTMGTNSTKMVVLERILPIRIKDAILKKRYGLNKRI